MKTRKVIYGGACSLDGYLAGKNDALDWLHMSKDVEDIMRKSWASTDTILVGRKTWEFSKAMGGGGEIPGVQVKSYVFSRTLKSISDKDTELVTTDAGEFVRRLKAQPGKDIIVMSGGDFATSLLKEDLIDEIGLNIHPVLLGGGVPAFLDPGMRVNLELTETRQLDGGCVLVNYRVKR
ncbi:MAG TPA: dihydrofolate reductase family protein [Vicinamibacterales bacterium]|nr:dihydrofolate reductase family protein [Vicinamibacterales bacterium]